MLFLGVSITRGHPRVGCTLSPKLEKQKPMVLPNSRMVDSMILPNRAWWLSARYRVRVSTAFFADLMGVMACSSWQSQAQGLPGLLLAQRPREDFAGRVDSGIPGLLDHTPRVAVHRLPHLNIFLPKSDQIDEFTDSHLLPSPATRSCETTRLPLACSALLSLPLIANRFQTIY
jgi:hypothetical protein